MAARTKAGSPVRHLVLRVVDGGATNDGHRCCNGVHWSCKEKAVLLPSMVYPTAVATKVGIQSCNSPPAMLQMPAA
jgi:hypothetical protein